MDTHFVDRRLSCSDCHGEFIFTAGEQLFFHDKQFKNDPKRCKPCKSRRSGLAAAANGTGPAMAGLSRTETRTECSDCGVETTVPFKPTQGRPVLCRQCFQSKNRAAAAAVQDAARIPMAAREPLRGPLGLPAMPAGVLQANAMAETITGYPNAAAGFAGVTSTEAEALLTASSVAAASPQSSVASVAEVTAALGLETPAVPRREVPAELLAAASAEGVPAELIAASVEAAEA